MWQKIKGYATYVILLIGAVITYIGFIRKEKPEGLPERPDKYPGGDKKPVTPKEPKATDWAKKVSEDTKKIDSAPTEEADDLVKKLNNKYNEE